MLQSTTPLQLRSIAQCHMACFPESLSTKLGIGYVTKTLEWFLVHPDRFLFHVERDGIVAGYCGGFVPRKHGDGSSSGMLQYAFSEAIKGLLTHPWLLLHAEVRPQYRFLWMNIKRKITGKTIPIGKPAVAPVAPSHVGLVVIGVHPQFRGTDVSRLLADEFEKRAATYNREELFLSVKKDNLRAVGAYKKFGWTVYEEQSKTYVMRKMLSGKY